MRRAGCALILGAALAAACAVVPAGRGAAAGADRQRHWCETRSSAAWRRVLRRHVVPLSRTTSLVPWALAHDGRSFFATVYSPRFCGVARIGATGKRLTPIKAFPKPPLDYQAGGAFDGRWLVWSEYHGFESFDDFTVWAWDSRSGDVHEIGASTRSPEGGLWESPWRQPDVRGGIATWVQGSGPDGLTVVRAYDLRTGQDRVVHEGHAQGSFLLDGHLVAWPESPSRGAETRVYVASALTGALVPTPRALQGLRGVSGLATDGHRIAYPDGPYKSLWWSPSLLARPRKVVAARGLNYVDNSMQIGGHYVGFGMQPRVFVGDTRTRRYVSVTTRHSGYTRIDSRSLLLLYATGSGRFPAVSPIAFVALRDLPPLPAC